MGISYQGRDIQKQSDVGLRLEKLPFVDYTNYDETTGLGAVQSEINWLVADNNLYSSSVEFDKQTSSSYSASYFLPTIINISGSFYGSLSGTATSASYALSASYAPLSIDTSSFYVSSPGNILFVKRYLLIAKGDGNIDVIDLSTLEAASASYATYALTASYATGSIFSSTNPALSSSYALTASFALTSAGGGSAFPFTGSALITGSLGVTGSTSIRGTFNQGSDSLASGLFSHVQGFRTTASGDYSHAEGRGTVAFGTNSHAEGQNTTASGSYSHAEGLGTVALGDHQHVQGQFNISSLAQSAFIIGNGTSDAARSNLVFASGSQVQITGSLIVSGSSTFTNIGPAVFSGSVNSQGGFTGSLQGTASFATTASFLLGSVTSASFASTASFVNPLRQTVQITGSLTVTGSVISNTDGLNRLARYGTALSGSTIGTGVTAQTIVYSQLIPANTFGVGNVIETVFRFRKLSTNSNATYSILLNTSNVVAGATTIAILTANQAFNQMKRNIFIAQGNFTTFLSSGVSSGTDDGTNTLGSSTVTWTSDQYLIYTVTPGTTDSGYGLGFTIQQVL